MQILLRTALKLRLSRLRMAATVPALLIGSAAMFAPQQATAQADTGRIGGTVTDASGAVIVGATVTATQIELSKESVAKTDKRGDYVFPNLQVGHYTIQVQQNGFASETKQGYELDDNSALTVNFSMQAGQTEQMIVTTQVGETVNTQTGEVSHVIDGDTVRDLALNGRNYLDLLGILPGSVVTDGGDALGKITTGATDGIVLNGVRATANGLYIDGIINKDIGTNANQFNNVGLDFIEHVKVETSSFSSQFGQAAGPAINVVTRTGTDTFHGSAFELIRNDIVEASNYFSKRVNVNPVTGGIISNTAVKQHLRFNDFGAAIGGPIIKQKLYFFGGTEWKLIAQNTNPNVVTLPLQSQLSGKFAIGSFASATTHSCPLRSVPGVPVDNLQTDYMLPQFCNISAYITPFGKAFANTYNYVINQATSYAGSDCTLTSGCTNNNGNTIYELPQPFRNHEYLGRIDWNINKRNNAYGRWIADTHTTTNPLGDGALPTTSYHDEGPANNVVLSHTLIVTPSSFNTISAGFLWSSINQQPYGQSWLKSTYGYTYQPLFLGSGPKIGIPQVSLYGYNGFDGDQFLNRAHTTYLQLFDTFTKVAGKHSTKYGVFFGRVRKDINGKPFYNGNINFTTAGSSVNSTGNAVADALLGNYNTYTEATNDTYGFFRLSQAAAFIDDTWRILPKLSLNLGVRYEWMTPWTSQQNNLAAFYPEAYDPKQAVVVNQDGTLVPGVGNRYNGLRRAGDGVPQSEQFRVPNANSAAVLSVPTIGKRGFYASQNVFAPRFGFAYDLFGNGYTAFRGGAGLFYDTPQGSVSYAALNAAPYLTTVNLNNGNVDNLAAYTNQLTRNTQGDQYAVSPAQKRAYVYQYNFGLQQQLDKGMFLQITYVGNEARHLLHNPDINGVDPAAEDAAFAVNQNVNINYLRPYKGYGAILQYRSDADGNYNGLQANLNRRVGKGRFTVAYTFSKSLSTSSSDGQLAAIFPYSKTYYYGYTTFDRRNIISTSYIATAPALAGHNEFIRAGLGSWQVSGIARYQGGTRLTPQATDALGVAGRAQYAGLPVIYNKTSTQWFDALNPGNIANLYASAPGQIGNAPVGLIKSPSYIDFDLSLRKTFNYTERYHLTLNFDGFNVLNHPNLNSPGVNINSCATYNNPVLVNANNTAGHDYSSCGITSASRPRQIQGGARFTF